MNMYVAFSFQISKGQISLFLLLINETEGKSRSTELISSLRKRLHNI